jgi:hypothetical protein
MSTPPLVASFYERLWNAGDEAAMSELLSAEFSFRGSLGTQLKGHAAFWEYVCSVRTALAHYRCEILDCISEGSQAFAKMRFSGVHVGTLTTARPYPSHQKCKRTAAPGVGSGGRGRASSRPRSRAADNIDPPTAWRSSTCRRRYRRQSSKRAATLTSTCCIQRSGQKSGQDPGTSGQQHPTLACPRGRLGVAASGAAPRLRRPPIRAAPPRPNEV